MTRKQVTAYLPNKRGALAKACRALASAKVNIEGISVAENTDTGVVRMVVKNGPAAQKALARAGIACTLQTVEVVHMTDKIGSLASAAAKLAKAGVNINYIYGSVCDCGSKCDCDCKCSIVVSATNLKKVKSLLG